MDDKYQGTIVEESLVDNRILNKLKIKSIRITGEENPNNRWHLYRVEIEKNEMDWLKNEIKEGWYMHFWKGEEVIALFKGKMFEFYHDKKESWKKVIDYGLSVGIPREQLDFPKD